MRTSRTWLGGALTAGLLSVSLVACTADPPDPDPQASPSASPTTESTPSGSPTTAQGPLRLTVYGVPPAVRAYRDAVAAFTDESGVAVEVEVAADSQGSASRVQQALEGDQPAPDVFLLDHESLVDVLDTGRLQRLDQAMEERDLQFGDGFQRVALTAFSADDGLQCMPVEMSPYVLFVNRDHVRPRDLEIRGVPLPEEGRWEFEAFDAAARLIAREHAGEDDFHAVDLPADVEVLTALLRSAGGDVVDDVDRPARLTLDSDEAREVLSAYVGLARESSVALTAAERSRTSALERFGAGELAMRFGTRADVPALREAGVRFDVMPLPTFGSPRTVADISGLCVDEESDRLEDALDLVAFLAGDEGSTTLARSGAVMPANLDVAFSPALAQRGQRPRSVRVFTDALNRSGLMPFSEAWRPAAALVERLVGELVASDGDLEEVLEQRLPLVDERSEALFEQAAEQPED